ncbi:phenoloxidase-activating factor 3 isoform X1 [Procambarus clarkii]|uniref:phenoloxidase-activating factor 3 isoform X1 n=1 Tax=Procambarus clarkii TaxID=6728 RepID=UPI003744B179
MWRSVWLLLVMVVVVAGPAVLASAHRHARQVAKCSPEEPCTPLNACQHFQNLLRGPSRNEAARLIRKAVCSTDRRNTMVCCPKSSGVTTPTTPRPTPTPTPATPPPAPTPTIDPAVGEASLPKSCGSVRSFNKIFFGEDANLGDHPWMALLGYGTKESPKWGCGAALITESYVLSAGHCVDLAFTGGLSVVMVRLGEHNLATSKDCETQMGTGGQLCAEPVQDIPPAAIYKHHKFNSLSHANDDISLLKLQKKATFNLFVQPICLPPVGFDVKSFLGGRNATVAGWGRTENSPTSDILQRVHLPQVDLEECKNLYEGNVTPDELCFGGAGRRDSCVGDSGGPLFAVGLGNPTYTLIGVVSRGRSQCGTPGIPAVYTNVAHYRQWIIENLRP